MDNVDKLHFVLHPEYDREKGHQIICYKEVQKGWCGKEFNVIPRHLGIDRGFVIYPSRSMSGYNLVNCPECLAMYKFARSKKGFEDFCEMYHVLNPKADFNSQAQLREFLKRIIPAYQFFMNDAHGYCDICGEPRTYNDIMESKPVDYLNTCATHRRYSEMLQVGIIRKILGITEVSNQKFTDFFHEKE